jgi:uncharacterized protein
VTTAPRPTAGDLIERLRLEPLPREGGWYRETHRSRETIAAAALPARYGRDKAFVTAIHYLLAPGTFSRLHRLPSDELYAWQLGDPARLLVLHEDGREEEIVLGPDLAAGQRLQAVVPAGAWQGSTLEPGGAWSLLAVVVAPGFDFGDYEDVTDVEALVARHPSRAARIRELTRR